MTFGQMQVLTQKFNQIIGASQILKKQRLIRFRKDLLKSHNANPDYFSAKMIMAVNEELAA